MPEDDAHRLPVGHQPYDPLNGLRVGALAGGLLGAIAAAIVGLGYAWLILVGAALGGAIGYWYERSRLRRRPVDPTDPSEGPGPGTGPAAGPGP